MPPAKSITVNMLSASDLYGGAGLASYRLLQGLERLGLKARLIVQDRQSSHTAVSGPRSSFCKGLARILPYIDPLPKLIYTDRHRGAWSCGLLPNPCLPMRQLRDSDIVHLHWVGGGLLPIRAFSKLQRPIVWTLHDAWPFTGGCHIPYECERYQQMCGDCPQLRSRRDRDLSRFVWEHKSRKWRHLQMTIVAPSHWIASLAASSTLFRGYPIEVIPNGVDLEIFSPCEKSEARRILGLPQNARLLLFSAFAGIANWNKGGDLLQESIHYLLSHDYNQDLLLLIVGSGKAPPEKYFPIPVVNYGVISDEQKKRFMYAAADITVVPSRSESLGYVVMESMACGTPCVSFAVGGVTDLISHRVNGYLAEPLSVEDFANGIMWFLNDDSRRQRISRGAREKIVENFSDIVVARQYESVYWQALERHRDPA